MIETNMIFWITCILFLVPLKHRSYYLGRLAAACVCACLFLQGLSAFSDEMVFQVCIRFILCTIFVWFCGALTPQASAYCAVWVVILCQTAYELRYILEDIPVIHDNLLFAVWMAVGYILILGVGGTLIAWTMPEKGMYNIGPRQFTSSLLILTIFEAMFAYLAWLERQGSMGNISFWTIFFLQGNCVTVMHLQNALFKKSAMKQELEILNRLWYQHKEQYELSEETVALINHKCHDLKHQIAAMRAIHNPEEQDKYLRKVEDSVQIYDSMVKTGNKVLDTLLTEKSLQCAANGIKVSCIADGRQMDIFDPVDLYTIFGNALDNAMEYVKTLEMPEMRMIDVHVYKRRHFLLIHFMNPLDRQLDFKDEIPVSTKPRNGYHGYGIKSIMHTVEKYNGFVKIETQNNIFSLNIMIPVSESKD